MQIKKKLMVDNNIIAYIGKLRLLTETPLVLPPLLFELLPPSLLGTGSGGRGLCKLNAKYEEIYF